MTRFNTKFSVKGISLLNSVMASSSSVQFKKFLFSQVDDIAGNEVSPTKQARGTQTPLVTERRKKPWEKPGSVRGQFSSGQTTQQFNSSCCKVRLEGSSGSRGLVLMAV